MARALRLEQLEYRDVPAFLTDAQLVVGADALSPPLVRLIDPATQAVDSQFLAFDSNFFGGVRVAVGDVTGDGHRDLVAAAGPSGGPVVKVFDGKTGAVLSTFFAYAPSFTGGVNVAVADVDGDGRDEVITGAGGGGGPQVNVFDGTTGAEKGAFFAYDPSVRGGVRVAAGDLTGDGKAEIVVGAGSGGGPQVGVFAADGSRLSTYFAYAADFQGGVRVGVAELTGDAVGEVITSPGPTGAAQVNVYEGTSATATTALFGFPTDQVMGAFVTGSPQQLAIPSTPQQTIDASYTALEAFKQTVQPPPAPQPTPPGVVVVPVPVYDYYPWWAFPGFGLGLGYGFGMGFYDAPGLYAPYGIPYAVDVPVAADYYYDPFGFDYYEPMYADPGYYDPGYIDPGYYDPGYYDPYGYSADYGYSDYGYSDYGGYYDPGFYYSDF